MFWNHGGNDSETIKAALIKEEVTQDTNYHTIDLFDPALTNDPPLSVSAHQEDDSYAPVEANGIIMYNIDQIQVTVNNPYGGMFGMRVEQDPYGPIEPLKTQGTGWVHSDPEGADIYDLPVAYQSIIPIELNPENNGGKVRISLFFYLGQELEYGPWYWEREEVATFEFDVINFKILSLEFVGDEPLNVKAGVPVPTPHWSKVPGQVKRIGKPRPGVEYSDTVSSPVAVVKGNPLKIEVKYECHGERSVTLFANCISSTPDDTSCLYGDSLPFTQINCPSGGGIGEKTIESTTSNPNVTASLIHYYWKIKNVDVNGVQYSGTYPIEESFHRLYTLQDNPVRVGWVSVNPWIPILEIATNLAEGATGYYTTKSLLESGIYNSLWIDTQWRDCHKIYFSNPSSKLIFNGFSKIYHGDRTPFRLVNTTPFYLADLLDDLQKGNLIQMDCYSYNGLFQIASDQLGVPLSGLIIFPISLTLTTKCLYVSGHPGPIVTTFDDHFVLSNGWNVFEKYYWDSSSLHYKYDFSLPCSNSMNDYNLSLGESEIEYLKYTFQNSLIDFMVFPMYFNSINTRRDN